MKLFLKSAPLQLPELTRLREPDRLIEFWNTVGLQYGKTIKLLQGFGLRGGPGIHSLQHGPHTFSPLGEQLHDPVKKQHSFIPDIWQYLTDNGVTDRDTRQAFVDAHDDTGGNGVAHIPLHAGNDFANSHRILVDKEAADVHEKMARATRQSGFGRNNPGYEFADSAELASHDFGDIRHFEHPVTGATIPLFHVRRAVVVNRHPFLTSSSSNLYFDSELHSRAMEAFRLGDHPSYGYLGVTHTHPAFGTVIPSRADREVHDRGTPYGYSHVIRPGINIEAFNRQVIARYGSAKEAFRQWKEDGDDRNMAFRYWQFLKNQDPPTAGTGDLDSLYASGRDRAGMSFRRDSRVFMVREPLRPLQWGPTSPKRSTSGRAAEPMRRPDQAHNYALASDFTSAHPHHVIYVGENDAKAERRTRQSIISRRSFRTASQQYAVSATADGVSASTGITP